MGVRGYVDDGDGPRGWPGGQGELAEVPYRHAEAPGGDGYGGEDDTRGEDEVAAPAQLRAIGTLLEQMGVTDPEEQQGVVNRLAGIVHNAQLPKVEATRIMRTIPARRF